MKRPSFQFYPGDWLRDTALRTCSVGARGLWIDMLCLMHEGEPYGHLRVGAKVITPELLSRMEGADLSEVQNWLQELSDARVYSKADDGAIYSRRMVRDEERRQQLREDGKTGGNPALCEKYNAPGFVYAIQRKSDGAVKIGIAQNVTNRFNKIRYTLKGSDDLTLLASWPVQDMGKEEKTLHQRYQEWCVGGEWFNIPKIELDKLLTLMGSGKGKTRASSSSSSSESTERERRLHGIPSSVDEVITYGKTCFPKPVDESRCRAFWSHYEGQRRINHNGEIFWVTSGDAVVTNWKVKLPEFGLNQTRGINGNPKNSSAGTRNSNTTNERQTGSYSAAAARAIAAGRLSNEGRPTAGSDAS